MKPAKLVLVSLIGALGACATTPPPNTALDRARDAVSQAAGNPQITGNAPVELQRAQDTLHDAERAWRNDRDEKRVEHLAYLATQRAAIARETAGIRAAEQAVKLASEQRDQLILQARTREAEQAKQLAATSQSEAERARREAERAQQLAQSQQQQTMSAEQRAERLQAQLNELQAQPTDRGLNVVLSDVLFETGQATLKPGAARRLQQLADVLRENPDHVALVEGFTDSVGSDALNEALSQRRAEAVRDALASLGVDPARIQVHGYGEDFPVASNRTPAGRQENRRVEIVVSSGSDDIPLRGFTGPAGGQSGRNGAMDAR